MDAEGREMGVDREARRLDEAAAERLLAGEDVGYDDLSGLLAAAAGPARRHELTGETEALVAFRYAQLASPGGHARRSKAKTMWPRLAGIKVAAIAVALATAGVAVAAGTGVLPTPFTDDPPTAAPELTSSQPRGATDRTDPIPGGGTSAGPGASSTAPPATTDAPSSLVGLCRAYEARKRSDPERALDSPSLRPLIEAAGGRDKVDGYCEELLATSGGKPTKSPNDPHPSGPPAIPGAAGAGTPPPT
jgi:hypothetical protein